MSDSRSRRSHSHRNSEPSSSSSSSTSHRRSSRNLQATSSSSASRSSTSLRSTSGRSSRSSGGGASSNTNNGSSTGGDGTDGGGGNPIYGGLGPAAAGGSRYSLTDQFAATRSVYDFGFDDAASSIFDSSSVFSVETVRGAGIMPSFTDLSGSDTSDAVMVGYSTVLEAEEEDEDGLQLTPQTTPTKQRQGGEGDLSEDIEKQSQQQPEPLSSPIQQPSLFQQRLQQQHEDEELLRTPVADATLLQLQKRPVKRTYYELLCLSRQPPPRPAQIRAAYYRLFRLLNSDNSSRRIAAVLQPTAALYFAQIQLAFETLIDPARRLQYDHRLDDFEDEEDDGSSDTDSEDGSEADVDETVEAAAAVQRQQALMRKQELQASTDVGVRFDASRALLPRSVQRNTDNGDSAIAGNSVGSDSLPAFDYSLKQVVRVGLPSMGRYTQNGMEHLQRRVEQSQRLLQDKYGVTIGQVVPSTKRFRPWPIRCGIPVLSLSASTYAVTATGDVAPLVDRYQPLLPEVLGPNRIAQLAKTRSTGHIVLSYRQEFWGPSGLNGLPPTVAEVETEILPRVAFTTRVAHTVPLPADGAGLGTDEPLQVEVMVQSGKSYLPSASPRIGLGLSRRMGIGHYFLCADSGNRWSSAAASYVPTVFAPLVAPMMEVGYSVGPHEMGMHTGNPLTGPADRGLKGTETDLDILGTSSSRGTWTVSTAISGNASIAAYLRYGRTLFLVPWQRLGKKTLHGQRGKNSSAIRVEAEFSADRFADGYLAVRGLAPVRWFGFRSRWTSTTTPSYTLPKLGVEVAMSASSGSVHVSLYWSRASQRIKIPFLLLPAAHTNVATNIFFWAAILPVAAMAGLEFAQIYLRAKRHEKRRQQAAADAAATAADGFEGAIDEYDPDEEQAIANHRAEADELTMLLASAVDAAQNANPKESKEQKDNSLIIISAKYGVALADDNEESEGNDNNDGGYGFGDNDSVNSLFGGSATPSTVILAPSPMETGLSKKVTAMATRNGWAPDYEVADVTSALAALVVVDNSPPADDKPKRRPSMSIAASTASSYSEHILIPRGLRKSRLIGFWDPAPNYETKRRQLRQQFEQTGQQRGRAFARKVLHVRYRWHGQEHIAEVGDREELRLP